VVGPFQKMVCLVLNLSTKVRWVKGGHVVVGHFQKRVCLVLNLSTVSLIVMIVTISHEKMFDELRFH